jgi:hypothetical protein
MFRFTIRELQWLTVVVGLGVGWWISAERLQATRGRLKSELMSATHHGADGHRAAALLEAEVKYLREQAAEAGN